MNIASTPKQSTRFVKEAREELKKVNWPSREQTIRYTLIVIVASIAIGMVTGGVDYILSFIIEQFIL